MILSNSIACRVRRTRCTMMRFSLIDFTIKWLCLELVYWYGNLDRFFHAHIAYVIDTDKKSSQHSPEFPIVCLIWYARIQSSVMFKQQDMRWCGFRWSIPLSIGSVWNSGIDMAILTPSCKIAYITHGAKIIAAFCRTSHCLHDFIRLNSNVGDVQTTRCTMIWFSMIDSHINWLCLKCAYSRGYLDSLILILHMK